MTGPFKLFGRLILAMLKIAGYTIVYGLQAVWFALHGRRDRIGDAIGYMGRSITDAMAGIFEK